MWDVYCEQIVAFHIHQNARSPRLTTERHSATLTCILAPDQWIRRDASELPLVAPVNAEPHKTYVSVSTPALAHVLRFYSSWSFSRKLLPSERPTRPHAAHLVFHCLDLSKDPIWSSCVYRESHLSTRDCRHLCRSPPCSLCFLHVKNLLVVSLDLFFIPVRPEDSQKTRPTAPWWSTSPVQVSGHFTHLHVFKVETGNLESTIQQHLSFPCSRRHCTSQTSRSFTRNREMVEFLPRLQLQRWAAEARDVRVDALFGVLTFCRIPDGTRITRPFVVWFPACVV